MMDMVDLFDSGVFTQRRRIETHLADLFEGRFQSRQVFYRGLRADVLVMIQYHHAIQILDRNQGFIETAFSPCVCGFLLRLQGKIIDIAA